MRVLTNSVTSGKRRYKIVSDYVWGEKINGFFFLLQYARADPFMRFDRLYKSITFTVHFSFIIDRFGS